MSESKKTPWQNPATLESRALEEQQLRKWNTALEKQFAHREHERAMKRAREVARTQVQLEFVERALAHGMSTHEIAEILETTADEVEALRARG